MKEERTTPLREWMIPLVHAGMHCRAAEDMGLKILAYANQSFARGPRLRCECGLL